MANPKTTPNGSGESAGNGSSKRRFSDTHEPLTGDQQRTLCFSMFNKYWEDAAQKGVDFDVIGTLSISAALFGIVGEHGKRTAIEFIGDLKKSVENKEFDFKQPA